MGIAKKRWIIFVLLILANVINYIDRQALSILAPVLNVELGLSNFDYSMIVNAFLIAYALSYLVSGYVIDRIGGRIGVGICILGWSIAASLHAVAGGFVSLIAFRFLLGVWESGVNPGAVNILTRMFAAKDRGFTIGMVMGGAAIGAVFAPVVIVWLLQHGDWRFAFLVTGLIGFVVVGAWFLTYRPADDDLTELPDFEDEGGLEKAEPFAWRELLYLRSTWIIVLLHTVAGPVFFFFMFWLPSYLAEERGFSMELIGQTTWIPYLGEFIGLLIGSLLANQLIKRGFGALRARKAVALICAAIVPVSVLFALQVTNPYAIVILMAFAMLGIGMQVSSFGPLPADIYPHGNVGSITGIAGLAGSIAGVAFTTLVGVLADADLYIVPFWIVAVAYPLAMLVFALLLHPAKRAQSGVEPVPATIRSEAMPPTSA